MYAFRKDWLVRLTIASLGVVVALFVAHLGAHDHASECHACEIAAHALAEAPPAAEFGPQPEPSPTPAVQVATSICGQPAASTAPRAPPLS